MKNKYNYDMRLLNYSYIGFAEQLVKDLIS